MTEKCPFCAIARGEAAAAITYEDDEAVAFKDTAPMAPFHELVIPRRHITCLSAAAEGDQALFGKLLFIGRRRARETGHSGRGYRVVMNDGRDGHQTVGHVHLHVLAGRPMGWPPG